MLVEAQEIYILELALKASVDVRDAGVETNSLGNILAAVVVALPAEEEVVPGLLEVEVLAGRRKVVEAGPRRNRSGGTCGHEGGKKGEGENHGELHSRLE